ncbi:Endoglucanase [Diplonema papillatum]|nr:Endoglucanase [Diplonema papillatum]
MLQLFAVAALSFSSAGLGEWEGGIATWRAGDPAASGAGCGMDGDEVTESFPHGMYAAADDVLFRGSAACGACYEIECGSPFTTGGAKDCTCRSGPVVVQINAARGQREFGEPQFAINPAAMAALVDDTAGVCEMAAVRFRRVACPFGAESKNARITSRPPSPQHPFAFSVRDVAGWGELARAEVRSAGTSEWIDCPLRGEAVRACRPPVGHALRAPLSVRLTDFVGSVIHAAELVERLDAGLTWDLGRNFASARTARALDEVVADVDLVQQVAPLGGTHCPLPDGLEFDVAPANNTDFVACHGKLSVSTAHQLVDEFGDPVQLMGVSTHGLHWFPACYQKASIRHLVERWGVNVFRAAMHIANAGYATNPAVKDMVKSIVQWCKELGIYVIIDWHVLEPGDPFAPVYSGAKEFFKEMAELYINETHVIYEICNEPNEIQWSEIKAYADDTIATIRAINPDAVILVGTPDWSRDLDAPALAPVADPRNVMYTFHFYTGTHMHLLPMVEKHAGKLPIFISEMGTSESNGQGGPYLESAMTFLDLFKKFSISWVHWSYSDKPETTSVLEAYACRDVVWDNTTCAGTFLRSYLQTNVWTCNGPPTPRPATPPPTDAPPVTPPPPPPAPVTPPPLPVTSPPTPATPPPTGPVTPPTGPGTPPTGPVTPPTGPATPPTGPVTPPTGPGTPPTGPVTPPTGPGTPPTGPGTPPTGPVTPPTGPGTPPTGPGTPPTGPGTPPTGPVTPPTGPGTPPTGPGTPPTGPGTPPTGPGTPPTGPVTPPTGPGTPPTGPGTPPTGPGTPPTGPGTPPTGPGTPPTGPGTPPTGPGTPPTGPGTPPTGPGTPPTGPGTPPTEPGTPPTGPGTPPTGPVTPPTGPVTPPTGPGTPPTGPGTPPTGPGTPPTEPGTPPTGPGTPPTEPGTPPTEPGTPPTGPGTPPTGPVTPPTGPVTPPTGPVTPPTGPGTPPTGPGTPPTGPGTPPTGPGTPPTEPGTPPTGPGTPPTGPVTPPTGPGTPPTGPGTPPTGPGTPPTEPGTPPTEPGTPPTGPVTPPTGPVTPPTGPVTPPTGPGTPPTGPGTPPTGPVTPPGGPDDNCKLPEGLPLSVPNIDNTNFVSCHGRLSVTGTALTDERGDPVQLMGMSSHVLHLHEGCHTRESIQFLVKTWGINVFRAAVSVGNAGYASDPEGVMAILDDVVGWCKEAGVYVVVDWHVQTPGDPNHAAYAGAPQFFKEVARAYKAERHVLYEICSQPSGVAWAAVKGYAERILAVIRGEGADGVVIVGTPDSSLGVHDPAKDPIVGAANVMYAFHFAAGSHGFYLNRVKQAAAVIPLFVTQWVTTKADGTGDPLLGVAEGFLDYFAEQRISWIQWSYSDAAEAASVLTPGACGAAAWDRTTCAGSFARSYLKVNVATCAGKPAVPSSPQGGTGPCADVPCGYGEVCEDHRDDLEGDVHDRFTCSCRDGSNAVTNTPASCDIDECEANPPPCGDAAVARCSDASRHVQHDFVCTCVFNASVRSVGQAMDCEKEALRAAGEAAPVDDDDGFFTLPIILLLIAGALLLLFIGFMAARKGNHAPDPKGMRFKQFCNEVERTVPTPTGLEMRRI